MFEELRGKQGLLIHHWDTDGICSAVLLLQRLGEQVVNKTPVLGNYFLTEEELAAYSEYEFVVVADMALPEENIRRLAASAQVFIFDHHLQSLISGVTHENPVSRGEPAEKFPSASWIINTFLGNPVNLFSVLGVVGDHEERIEANKEFAGILYSFCLQHQLMMKELLAMVYLLDSSYKVGNRKAVMDAPRLLLRSSDPKDILGNVGWKKNLVLLEDEIRRWVEYPGEEVGGVCVKRMRTKCNIISTVTRKVFWETKQDTVTVNSGFFHDCDQVYVRSNKNLQALIEQGRTLGCRCGGKAEVMGAVVPKGQTDEFVKMVLGFLAGI